MTVKELVEKEVKLCWTHLSFLAKTWQNPDVDDDLMRFTKKYGRRRR